VGESNYERAGTVRTVEFRRWDDTPYPLEKTKEIIRLANDEAAPSSAPRMLTAVVEDKDQ
jgi:hypothetical protein